MSRLRRLLYLNANYYVLRREPVIVYSMERTGSVALIQSLEAHGVFVVGTHYLDPAKIELLSGSARWASKHVIRKGKRAKLISLVRNPIENMASVFARTQHTRDGADAGMAGSANSGATGADPAAQFVTDYLEKQRHLKPLNWFDTEYKVALGIDVYRHPFDKQAGFARFQEGPFDLLILRTELSDERKAAAVADFLGLRDFGMQAWNASPQAKSATRIAPGAPGDQTAYGESYKQLKQNLVVPDKYWHEIATSRFARHFFDASALEDARARYAR